MACLVIFIAVHLARHDNLKLTCSPQAAVRRATEGRGGFKIRAGSPGHVTMIKFLAGIRQSRPQTNCCPRRQDGFSVLNTLATLPLCGLRFLSAESMLREKSGQLIQSVSNTRKPPKPRAAVQAPPWIKTKEELNSKYWLGRKPNQLKWMKQSIQKKMVENPRVNDWASFFASRKPNVRSVNTLLRVFNMREEPRKVLEIFREMEQRGVLPNEHSYVAALTACASLKDLDQATVLFREMVCRFFSCQSSNLDR